MLLIRDNAEIKFSHDEYAYFLSLKNSRNPTNKSHITVVNFTGKDYGRAVSHRDVYEPHELKSDLPVRGAAAMGLAHIEFMLVFCLPPGTPVLNHVHKAEHLVEAHYQPVIGLSPGNDIKGLVIDGYEFDLTGHNSILLNVKLPHWVNAQHGPTMWLTSFGARLK